jgi:site-specific DNA-cytosine methylase
VSISIQQNQTGEIRTGEVAGTLNQNSNASVRNTPLAFSHQANEHHSPPLRKSHMGQGVMTRAAVRRLTPLECERLQGFPENHTNIPNYNPFTAECPDSPRYKALGNSMAVPVMRWIGERIALVDSIK